MFLLAREEHLHARPHIDEMPCCCKGITAIVSASGKDSKHLARRTADHLPRFLCRPPPGIFHQSDSGQPITLLHCSIDAAHILCKRYIHH